MGADRAVHVESGEAEVEPLSVAKILAKVVEREKTNLVILGKQAIDDDNGQTGQMLSGLLGWGQATQAAKVEIKADGAVDITCEIDGGQATVATKLPVVITTDLRLNEPRYTSLPNIMKAKKKPMDKLTPQDLGVSIETRLETLNVREPPPRKVREPCIYMSWLS
jgi:electron transfer flavoprotein beta subunit